MPRVSVVVPVYDVESYLATCLQSLARQTERDLEVIMVDDGSTDGSRAIAERFAEHDPRFRLVCQDNGGLGSARNAGAELATGEFLAFVDSDDVLPHDAYARLLGALDATGSDFASGNVQRLTRTGTTQAQFLARTFARTRLRTHVRRCRLLLADRTAWNKLYRRAFWDAHGFRFPEGVVHEDIPVTLPAHHLAGRVDVIAAPVYQWRVREDGAPSITQRRLEPRVLRDRLAAIAAVRVHLAAHGERKLARWYDASLVADDLRLHLDLLDEGCDAYRALFLDGVGELLDGMPRSAFAGLPAIDRLKWHLIRAGRVDEAMEVIRFAKQGGAAAVRERGRYYGAYPLRGERGIPRSTYRLGRRDEDLALTAELVRVEHRDGKLRLHGRAGIASLDGARQRTALVALRRGRLRALRLRVAALRIPTAPGREGFDAALDPARLRGRAGTWDVYATARSGLLRRRRARFVLASPELIGAVDLGDGGMRAAVTSDGALRIEVRTAWAELRGRRVRDGVLELDVALHGTTAAPVPAARRRSDGRELALGAPEEADGVARLPLAALVAVPPSPEADVSGGPGAPEEWELSVGGLALALPADLADIAWRAGDHEVALSRTRRGDAALVSRRVVTPVPAATPSGRARSRAAHPAP